MKFAPKALNPYISARHYFGSELRRHREKAKLSLLQLSGIVNFSKSSLARVEAAELMPPPELPGALDLAFGLDKYFYGLFQLAKREAHPDQYRRYVEFEAQAIVIEDFASQVMPGLLQTKAYAHAVLSCEYEVTPELVEERLQARLSRQERMHSARPPRYWAILDEAVLHRAVGGPQVMIAQLNALLPLVDTSTAMIQVLPFSHGAYALIDGPLKLLRLLDGQTVAYEESRKSGHLLEDKDDVCQRQALYDALRAYALTPADSASLIREAVERYESCEAALS
ncbi:Helix-turn-helix domain-containing protein [Streptomyces sp. 2224.1]|uniref:helix-turn-helix domain-containing protein n=1 Tax=unclassified Streptomyces TaxID=2593676 RepID=UPI000894C5FE|nr:MULTISPECIES: Scr1 family TA system antitoxin-like transcriptional regulator [unclassified Streptomyces]SEB65863.1 Helix-turn-helix domain-containing protein [Streptomyces sp. 2224.1]SEE46468.1 Helix-turn-helix domain-containing protein [Streptomyces sp. 2112.3]